MPGKTLLTAEGSAVGVECTCCPLSPHKEREAAASCAPDKEIPHTQLLNPPRDANMPTAMQLFLQDTELRSRVLEQQLQGAEQRLEESQEEQENFRKSLRTLLELLDGKIFELTELRDTLARLIEEAS